MRLSRPWVDREHDRQALGQAGKVREHAREARSVDEIRTMESHEDISAGASPSRPGRVERSTRGLIFTSVSIIVLPTKYTRSRVDSLAGKVPRCLRAVGEAPGATADRSGPG